ncbi:MAG: hypothetical protein GWP91_07525 [Rhodobacterales bacterium]|nr:hypothetical protein [Rhodobacterales bacterium]
MAEQKGNFDITEHPHFAADRGRDFFDQIMDLLRAMLNDMLAGAGIAIPSTRSVCHSFRQGAGCRDAHLCRGHRRRYDRTQG